MESHEILMQLITLLGLFLAATATPVSAQPQSGCQNSCGNTTIPYPFGTADGCYIAEDFLITCNTTFNPPKAFLDKGNVEVLDISLQGQLRILQRAAYDCYNLTNQWYRQPWLTLSKFPISNTRNMFTAVGCDTFAVIKGSRGRNYETGCLSLCEYIDDVSNGSCSGIGCCQTSIPGGVRGFDIDVSSYDNHRSVLDFNPCSYAFVVENGAYNFSSADLRGGLDKKKFPLVLDWAIENETCDDAKKNRRSYACKANNSYCYSSDNGSGYRCNCSEGFHGNPYLTNGCQDTNECETLSPCNGTCHNSYGSFNCSCPEGYKGDGRKDGIKL